MGGWIESVRYCRYRYENLFCRKICVFQSLPCNWAGFLKGRIVSFFIEYPAVMGVLALLVYMRLGFRVQDPPQFFQQRMSGKIRFSVG